MVPALSEDTCKRKNRLVVNSCYLPGFFFWVVMRAHSAYVSLRRRWMYRSCIRSGLIILRYHSVAEPSEVSRYLDPALSISPDRFREHVRVLMRRFRIVLPDEIPSLLLQSRATQPVVAITFDDGYRDNYDVALPILQEEGALATFYVTTGPLITGRGLWTSELWRLVPRLPYGPLPLPSPAPNFVPTEAAQRWKLRRQLTMWLASLPSGERENALDRLTESTGIPRGDGLGNSFLTRDHLRYMRKVGMTIGAHTRSHPHLDRLSPSFQAEEVQGSVADLETILGVPVRHFAYPNPGGGLKVCTAAHAAVKQAGFMTAVTSISTAMRTDSDPLCLPRIGVHAGEPERLLFNLLQDLPCYTPKVNSAPSQKSSNAVSLPSRWN